MNRSNQRPDTLMQDRSHQIDDPSCDARPDHTLGSLARITRSPAVAAPPPATDIIGKLDRLVNAAPPNSRFCIITVMADPRSRETGPRDMSAIHAGLDSHACGWLPWMAAWSRPSAVASDRRGHDGGMKVRRRLLTHDRPVVPPPTRRPQPSGSTAPRLIPAASRAPRPVPPRAAAPPSHPDAPCRASPPRRAPAPPWRACR